MTRMTGGQALVRALEAHGVDTIFGIPGVQMDHFFNALHDERNSIRVIHTRHEQGAAYMAFGYAAATGKVGTYAVVPGPGLLNTTAALSTAYANNAPVLCVAGQIASQLIGRGVGVLHEIPDQLSLIKGLTKWAARADHPNEAPDMVREAFRQLSTGRIRPVEIEMAMDVLGQSAELEIGAPTIAPPPPEPDPELITNAAKLLGGAKRPLIFAGGGAVDAGPELLALAEALQAPIIASRNALGVVDDRHYLSQGFTAGHRLWADADVVLGVGTRLNPQIPSWGMDDDLKFVRIDIDPVEVTRVHRPAVGIVSDARTGLAALVDAIGAHNRQRDSREAELIKLKSDIRAELHENLGPQMAFLDAIRAELPEDGVFVEELTQVGYVSRLAFPVYHPRGFISTGYQGTLGFGFATALGVKVARPDTPVVAISGDGGFMFNVQELATAVQQGIGLVTVIFKDGAFGNVQRMQKEDHGGKVIATDLHNPDFAKLAELFGAQGLRADTPDQLRDVLRKGFDTAGPTIIEVPVGEMPSPWDYIFLPRAR
jgi:acetolactate synthase I/II/III large subunit